MIQGQNTEPSFAFLAIEIRICLGFRVLDLEFLM